ncbi:YhdP family protein [Thalassotalea maritima]|uniref:YhdP family protein n=1 Tax=Thalassotalea maritima TaxID=3242416 RepID=UPI00352905C8
MKSVWAFINTWLNRLYKSLAILLVLLAVLITSARVLLPYADNFKQDIEAYVNQVYRGDVSIGELSAGWQGFGPTLIVRDVVLSDSEMLAITIDEVDVSLDVLFSVKNRQLKIKDLMLHGVEVKIDETQTTTGSEQGNADIDAVYDLVFHKLSRFSVVDANILHISKLRERSLRITKLAWHNEDERHQAIGKVDVIGFSSNGAKLIVDLRGANRHELHGDIFVQATNIDVTDWLSSVLGEYAEQFTSQINFDTWITIDAGKVTEAHVNLGENHLSWQFEDEQQQLLIPAAQLSIYRQSAGHQSAFSLRSSDIAWQLNEQVLRPLQITGLINDKYSEWYFNGVDVGQLWPLFSIASANNQALADYLALQPSGQINNVQVYHDNSQYKATLLFEGVSVKPAAAIPGVSNLSGQLLLSNSRADINFSVHDSVVDFAGDFTRPIPVEQLAASVSFKHSHNDWRLQVENINLQSSELTLTGDMQYLHNNDRDDWLSIFANLTDVDVSKVQYYLPLPLMSEGLVNYLTNAIKAGAAEQVAVIVNGPASGFPYKDGDGVFIVDADLIDTDFSFASSWPAITDASLNLNFTGNSMLITAYDGDLSGLKTEQVKVAIASLGRNSVLTVDAPVAGNVADVRRLMNASPLQTSVGKTLDYLDPSGDVTGHFNLSLPLSEGQAIAKGQVNFIDNKLNLAAPNMPFERVSGRLFFENDRIDTEDLTMTWLGLPMALDVTGSSGDNHYQLAIDMDGQWQSQHYQPMVPDSLQSYIDGQLDWQGKLSLFIPQQGNIAYDLAIDSSLQNLALHLPEPYRKAEGNEQLLRINAKGNNTLSEINAQMGKRLSFSGELNHDKVSFDRAQLVLGTEAMMLPMKGFHINSSLEHIEYLPWHKFIFAIIDALPKNGLTEQQSTEEYALLQAPERIRGKIDTLDVFGEPVNHIDFNLLNEPDWWLLQLNSDAFRGRARFYHEFSEKGIDIDADKIHLFANTDQSVSKQAQELSNANAENNPHTDSDTQIIAAPAGGIDLTSIPNLRVSCDSCKFRQFDFGKVNIEIEQVNDTLVRLNTFTAERNNLDLNLTGAWSKTQEVNETTITGSLNVDDVEREFRALQSTSGMRDSGFVGSYDIRWQGAPHDFNFATLNGDVKGQLDDGYLVEVSDQGARLLSLLSLQSLIRKLTFDFRDVFSEGMFYNDFEGDFNVVNGVVYTDNLKMDGVAGNLSIKGNTNFNTNQLDYKLAFAPKVTASLPVLVWLINPIAGAAALVVNEAIEKAEVISVINFELTGELTKPNFKEVDRETRNVNVGKSKPDASDLPQPNVPTTKGLTDGPQATLSKTNISTDVEASAGEPSVAGKSSVANELAGSEPDRGDRSSIETLQQAASLKAKVTNPSCEECT